jgi:hypothetical protein
MTDKEALKLALVALEANQPVNYCMNSNGERFPMMHEDPFRFDRNTKAITAIEEALAQPVQEPEYWNVIDPAGNVVASETDAIRGWARIAGSYKPTVEGLLGFHDQGWRVLPKITPPTAQPECARCKDLEEQAYDLLGQLKVANLKWSVAHPWVGLTEDEVFAVSNTMPYADRFEFAKAIEAKLKEKNT